MKRLFAIGLSLLMLVGFSADAVAMSDSAKQNHQTFVKNSQRKDAALAVDASGCWAASRGLRTSQAKYYALEQCASKCGSTCVIKDVNGKSAFIKQRGSSSSSSTASSSGKVWCGTKKEVTRVSRYSCEFYKGGKAFDTQSEATAFHKRLKGSSSSSSSTASSSLSTTSSSVFERTYCYSVNYDSFYRPATAHCSGSDKKVSKREFSNRHLDTTSNYSYSDKIWCVEKWDYTAMPYGQCVARGGEVFSSKDQAEAENKLRKRAEYKRLADSSDWKLVWCTTKWQVIRKDTIIY